MGTQLLPQASPMASSVPWLLPMLWAVGLEGHSGHLRQSPRRATARGCPALWVAGPLSPTEEALTASGGRLVRRKEVALGKCSGRTWGGRGWWRSWAS